MINNIIKSKKTELTRKSIIYFLNRTKNMDGRLKLMKLMFLLDHYDTDEKKITCNKTIGNQWVIYHRGPFSFEVYNKILDMINDGSIVEENGSVKCEIKLDKIENKIPDDVKTKLDKIIRVFGSMSGTELENKSLNFLNIKKDQKSTYMGIPIEVILSEN